MRLPDSQCIVTAWLAAVLSCVSASMGSLHTEVTQEGGFALRVGRSNQTWLSSAPLRVFLNGRWHRPHHSTQRASADGMLRRMSTVRSRGYGPAPLGGFSCTNVTWQAGDGIDAVRMHTSVQVYDATSAVIFTSELPYGASGTNASNPKYPPTWQPHAARSSDTAQHSNTEPHGVRLPNNSIVSRYYNSGIYPPSIAFPAFSSAANDSLLPSSKFVTWSDCQLPSLHGINITDSLQGLLTSAPVLLFDDDYTMVISPLDNFKSVVHTNKQPTSAQDYGAWETGVSSEIQALPVGFSHRTLVFVGSSHGVTATMMEWGQMIQQLKKTDRSLVLMDPAVNFLSYWTDNGAFYYGDAWGDAGGGGKLVNESSMRAVAAGLKQQGLLTATRIWQLDDWFYPGPPSVYVHCVSNWTLKPPAFTSTLGELSKAVETPWLLYVPFFCGDGAGGNVYQQLGYHFVQSVEGHAQFAEPHPDDSERFYNMLFDYGLANGLAGFENDFLNYNLLSIPYFRTVFNASSRWLAGINAAASARKLPIQLCMALPSDVMMSLEMDAVTNFRASTDYAFSGGNLNIGGTALLAMALGLRPSKDNLWTTRPQSTIATGKPWPIGSNPGSNNELNAIVATLSMGPFGISDQAGTTNLTLIYRACRADGMIIQPDRPISYIDAMFDSSTQIGALNEFNHKTGQQPTNGHVWGTSSSLRRVEARDPAAALATTFYLLSIDLKAPGWQVRRQDFFPVLQASTVGWLVHRWGKPCNHGALAVTSGCVLPPVRTDADLPTLLNDRPIAVANDTHQFDLHQFSPILENGWALLGDLDRYCAVSAKRFSNLTTTRSHLSVDVLGVPSETVHVTALQPRPNTSSDWEVLTNTVRFSSQCSTKSIIWQGKPTACVQHVTFSYD